LPCQRSGVCTSIAHEASSFRQIPFPIICILNIPHSIQRLRRLFGVLIDSADCILYSILWLPLKHRLIMITFAARIPADFPTPLRNGAIRAETARELAMAPSIQSHHLRDNSLRAQALLCRQHTRRSLLSLAMEDAARLVC